MLLLFTSPASNDMPSIISDQNLGQHFKAAAKAIAAAICAAYVAGLCFGQALYEASDALASFWRFLLVPAACVDDCSGGDRAQPQPQPQPEPCRTEPALTAADQEWIESFITGLQRRPEPVVSRDFLIPLV